MARDMKLLILVIIYGLIGYPNIAGSAETSRPEWTSGEHDSGDHSGGRGPVSAESVVGDINSDISADSQALSSNKTLVQVRHEYEEAARAVNLSLSYCQDGAGGSSTKSTIVIGGVDYVCKTAIAAPQILSIVAPLLKSAESYPEG